LVDLVLDELCFIRSSLRLEACHQPEERPPVSRISAQSVRNTAFSVLKAELARDAAARVPLLQEGWPNRTLSGMTNRRPGTGRTLRHCFWRRRDDEAREAGTCRQEAPEHEPSPWIEGEPALECSSVTLNQIGGVAVFCGGL
jgi:hypothetical protein